MKQRKGSVRDIVVIAGTIFIIAVAFLLIHFSTNEMSTALMSSSEINETPQAVSSLEAMVNVMNRLDYAVLLVFIFMVIGSIITAWIIGGQPVFMTLYIIVWIVSIALSAVLANTWETISTTSSLTASAAHFTVTNHLLSFLPLYIGVVGFIGVVVMFGKPRGEQYGY